MGSLTHWRLSDEFVRRFPVFIETGYGEGNGLAYAAKHLFEELYSIEIWPPAVRDGRSKFLHEPRTRIIGDHSVAGLAELLPCLFGRGRFFWLDAHFPGADCYGQPYDREPEWIALPLPGELDIIRRHGGEYTILIDDIGHYPAYGGLLLPFAQSNVICTVADNYVLICPHGAPQPEYVGERGPQENQG